MKVVVKMFAAARELTGEDEVVVELPVGSTVKQLRSELEKQYAELADLLPHTLFAIDAAYAAESDLVQQEAEVACIPPVSGG